MLTAPDTRHFDLRDSVLSGLRLWVAGLLGQSMAVEDAPQAGLSAFHVSSFCEVKRMFHVNLP